MIPEDKKWMYEALKEAEHAFKKDEIPVGSVIVLDNKIIGRGSNQVEMLKDPTAHAEMIAITAACNTLKKKWLHDATLYVTVEPCCMCAGALVLSRMDRLVYGCEDPKAGACGSLYNIVQDQRLNHCLEITKDILAEDCSKLLQDFFQERRGKNSSQTI